MPFSPGSCPARRSRAVVPAAVSALSAGLLEGAAVPTAVLGVHGPALYLDVAGRVLPVLTSDAVPLATALRLAVPAGRVPWGVCAGDVVTVGGGRVELPGCDLAAVRTWRPARVLGVGCSGGCSARHLSTRLDSYVGGDGPSGWLADGIRAVLSTLPGAGCSAGRPDSHLGTQLGVWRLLGRGPGLTPSGDDALAGILLVAHALGLEAPLAAAVRARLGATTAVSAALLAAAADGYAAPDVVALVDAALAGDDATVARTLPLVLAIGHTSGADLVAGIGGALHHLTPTPAIPTTPTGRSAA